MSNRAVTPSRKLRPAIVVAWAITLILTAVLCALGTWQLQRLSAKLQLIEQVESRAHGATKPLPANWQDIGSKENWEYSRVTFSGTFNHGNEVQVYTVSDIGPGYWILTPLSLNDGRSVFVNRGFVKAENRDPTTRAAGQVTGPVAITGLMRATETGGLFLRSNDLANQRYYRRDIAEIASAKDVANAAPFYVDADATANPGGLPIGGRTQLTFRNSHLSYAITWYILAAMMLAAGWFVARNLNSPTNSQEDI